MGMLVQGRWTDDDAPLTGPDGAFLRPSSKFRGIITADGSSGFAAEAGRYHLFLAPSCPWAHRTAIVRNLKGLEAVVSLTQADLPPRQGWTYSRGLDDLMPVGGEFPLHRVYAAAMPDYTGRVTVPVLWDRKQHTIVNNESSEIIRMMNSAFVATVANSIDLYPRELQAEIDAVNAVVYETVNNGVYRCGFAKTQNAYEDACGKLFATLDDLERRLAGARYLAGNRLTEADVRLFTTLVRFDAVYYGHFKCNIHRIEDYPNLSGYLRDLYQRPAFRDTVDVEAIKQGYYGTMKQLNPSGIVPLGPTLDFERPHGRERLGPQ